MVKAKKIKLKKKYRKTLTHAFIIVAALFCVIKLIGSYRYSKTDEYKLLKKGYDAEAVEILVDKLADDEIKYLIGEDKMDYVSKIVSEKYFISKNLTKYIEYFKEHPKKSYKDIVTLVNVGRTRDWYEDVAETDTSDKYLVLVNKYNKLPDTYDAGTIKEFSSTYAYGTVKAEETCYKAFIEMAKAAKKDDITLILTSGYRTNEYQKKTYNDMKSSNGQEYADKYAARPGQSEHETGLALDIFTYNGLMSTFKDTPTYAWLHENARHYGFIERYKENEEYVTGYAPEAWHYRYVGVELAEKIEEEGISYDEYYAYYLAK